MLISSSILQGQLFKNELLAQYTSWRVGGAADYLYIPKNLEDLGVFLRESPANMPVLWLGLGSNILVRDGGVDGIVVITQGALQAIEQVEPTLIRAEAGVSCAQFARHVARMGLTGVEFMAGIPGTVGGALAMNAGCYGGETWSYVHCVETMDRKGKIRVRPTADFEVAYRHVKREDTEWFVAGYFQLTPGDKTVSLAAIKSLLEKRNHSQPTGLPNCGSVFRNPPGNHAARLIEQSGLKKMAIGGAFVSDKHANFIINDGTATAADIERLIQEVGSIVEQKHGVCLIPEVCIVGK